MIRAVLMLAAFLSVFFFPYPATLALSFLASLAFAPTGFLVGVLADLLFAAPHATTFPLATLAGAVISALAYATSRFLRARVLA